MVAAAAAAGELVVAASDAASDVGDADGDAEPEADAKPKADAGPTCEVTPVTTLTGVVISKRLAGSAVPSPGAERIWGRLTGHAPCRLFFDFVGPAALGFAE